MKIYDPKIHEQLELPVSPILEKSLQFLEKERLDLRKYLWQIEQTLKQIFQAAWISRTELWNDVELCLNVL